MSIKAQIAFYCSLSPPSELSDPSHRNREFTHHLYFRHLEQLRGSLGIFLAVIQVLKELTQHSRLLTTLVQFVSILFKSGYGICEALHLVLYTW